MDGETFYEDVLKWALYFFDLSWGEKYKLTFFIKAGDLYVGDGTKSVMVNLEKGSAAACAPVWSIGGNSEESRKAEKTLP